MAEPADDGDTKRDVETFARWKAEIDYAQKDEKYVEWLKQSEKIVKRYRDVRKYAQVSIRKMNILWSNVQTLLPAVYGKMPKPIVERRFMDRDPAARLASTILERTLSFQMEVGYYHQSTSKVVLDYLLPGMGQVWIRYEPEFESSEEGKENKKVEREVEDEDKPETAQDIEEEGDGTPYEKVAYERACIDYVYYRNFLWGPAQCWQEVPWVDRIHRMTHSEIAETFYDDDMEKAKKITLDWTPGRTPDRSVDDLQSQTFFKKAEIHEIWNKADRTVYFIAPSTPGVVLKEEAKPELDLEGFWPCPEPLFTTQTNDTLVPVPDFVEYQDQAQELDDITDRISRITTAVKAAGVYDASVKELARLLQDGSDNRLIPVDSWAAFAEKGGMKGAVDLLPMQEIIEVLLRLYEARAQVKNDLYEVTGISDIVRGQSSTGAKTATEQRIKGQFGSMRLNSRQERVAIFCRDTLRIQAEIISEMFTDDSLRQMSGYDQTCADEVRKAVAKVPPPPPPPEVDQQTQQPIPPEVQQQMQQAAQQQFDQLKQQAAEAKTAECEAQFQEALRILRSDKLRGFRVDVETDSTIAADAQADKEAAIELFTGTMQGIQAIAPIAAAAPELIEPLGDLLMFAYRRFRVGRSMEGKLEEALVKVQERVEQQAQNPQPNPEQIKAQAEIQKQQMENQRAQLEFQQEQQRNQMEMDALRQKQEGEMAMMQAKIQFERDKLEIEKQKIGMQAQADAAKIAMDGQAAQQDAAIKAEGQQQSLEAQREQHTMDMDAAAQTNAMKLETMDAQAKAKQAAAAKPGVKK